MGEENSHDLDATGERGEVECGRLIRRRIPDARTRIEKRRDSVVRAASGRDHERGESARGRLDVRAVSQQDRNRRRAIHCGCRHKCRVFATE